MYVNLSNGRTSPIPRHLRTFCASGMPDMELERV
jgi:hypothetical protein